MSSLWRRLGTNGLVIRWWMKEIGALLFFRILRRSMLQSIHLSHGVVLPDRIKVGASSKSKYCCRKKHAKSQNKNLLLIQGLLAESRCGFRSLKVEMELGR
ncbi:hypothetical protein LINPERHAP1_LOCUS19273, partial [Linum perenne]